MKENKIVLEKRYKEKLYSPIYPIFSALGDIRAIYKNKLTVGITIRPAIFLDLAIKSGYTCSLLGLDGDVNRVNMYPTPFNGLG